MKIALSQTTQLLVTWNRVAEEFEVQLPRGFEAMEVTQYFDPANDNQLDPTRTGVMITTRTKGQQV